MNTKSSRIILVIFLIALGLRLLYFVEFRHNNMDFTFKRDADMHLYHKQATQIISGDLLLKNRYEPYPEVIYSIGEEKWNRLYGKYTYLESPGYPYFVALIYTIFGNNPYNVIFVQILLSALTCVLVFYIAEQLFNRKIAIISALLISLLDTQIFYSAFLLRDTIITFAIALLVSSVIFAKNKKSNMAWLLVGIIFGACYLIKESNIFILPFIILTIFILPENVKMKSYISMLFFVGAIIVLSPFMIRNVILGIKPLSFSSQPYHCTILYNMPDTPGYSWDPIRQKYNARAISEKSGDGVLSAFIQTIKAHPNFVSYLKLELKKFYGFWNGYEIMNQLRFYYYKRAMMFFKLPLLNFAIICPFCILGMFLLRKRWKDLNLLYGGILQVLLTALIALPLSRFRQSAYPFVVIFAGYNLYWLSETIRAKDRKKLVVPIISLLLLFVCLKSSYIRREFPQDDIKRVPIYFSAAYLELGKKETAEYLAKRSGNESAVEALVRFYDAEKHIRNDMYDAAIVELKKTVEILPDFVEARNNLGIAYQGKGRYDEALMEYERALKLDPIFSDAYKGLGDIYCLKGMYEDSITKYRQALRLNPGYMDAHYNLAVVYFKKGMFPEAESEWRSVLALKPGNVAAAQNLQMLKQSGKIK